MTVSEYVNNELASISQVRGKRAIVASIKSVRKKLKENDSTLSAYVRGALKRALELETEEELIERLEVIADNASTYDSDGEKTYEQAAFEHGLSMGYGSMGYGR
jgi:hypothetical protein